MKADVVIMGLGYIGLPTAVLIASNKTNVIGVDINSKVVDAINLGNTHIIEPDLKKNLSQVIKKGLLIAKLKPSIASTYIIVVPTPFKKNKTADISYIESATNSIIPLLKKNDLYIIESTVPVGITEKMRQLIYNKRPDLINELFIAYCPERVLPGNVFHELIYNDRVIGGINNKSTNKAIKFYSKYVKGNLHPTNSRIAEMCKLVENSSRDVQIAFANELSLICDRANINVWNLINLANKHPRVNILNPSCGVGGHCIAVDPYFIVSDYPEETKLISMSRKINDYKPNWCINKIKEVINKFQKRENRKPVTAYLGLSFKPNIDDLRESPANYIVESMLENENESYNYVVEPNLKFSDKFKLSSLEETMLKSDIIVILVAHNEFRSLKMSKEKIVLNFCGIDI